MKNGLFLPVFHPPTHPPPPWNFHPPPFFWYFCYFHTMTPLMNILWFYKIYSHPPYELYIKSIKFNFLLTFYFGFSFGGGGGWVGSRPALEEQCSGSCSLILQLTICWCCPFRGAGGGEVSGWGTLYMKWGAGRSSTSRVLKARADRETHTHLYFITLSPTHTK
jgi:hypothetical protein